jgi:serine/threonine-protein kinase
MVGQSVGSYRILSKLGEGGMGVVYLAEHPLIGRKAAVKVLLPQFSMDTEVVARFFNEARATNLIKHPSIVDVFDFGHLPDGAAFIVMEFLEGESLANRLGREPRPPLALAREIIRQLTAALGAAHRKGIVHRDLKPDNIYLVPAPDSPSGLIVKVLDFGIAKLLDEDRGARLKTNTNALIGTPSYMSPEQCRGAGHTDQRTDIYSCGCILFEMACGRVPFLGEGLGDIIVQHIGDAPPMPRSLAPELPARVEAVILRALAKKVDDRYQTIGEFSVDLESAFGAASESASLPDLAIAPSPSAGPSRHMAKTTLGRAASESIMQPARVSRRGVTVVSAAAILAVAGAVWFARRVPGETQPVTSTLRPTASGNPVHEPAKPPSTEVPPAATPRVEVRLESIPLGALVRRKGASGAIGKTPLSLPFGKEQTPIEVELALDGWKSETRTVEPSRSGDAVVVELRKSKPTVTVPDNRERPKTPKLQSGRGGGSATPSTKPTPVAPSSTPPNFDPNGVL